MQEPITKKIIEHYDKISPFYKKLWSEHIHHGYYETGKEFKKEATENLIRFLVKKSDLKPKSKVLDIGCGIGGTSIWLAKNLDCKVIGVTISPVQVKMAEKASAKLRNKPKFIVADANNLPFIGKFDAVCVIETISHYTNRDSFFKNISKMINKGGKIIIADWFKESNINYSDEKKFIKPIEKGMLVKLQTKEDYFDYLRKNSLTVEYYEDISLKVKKTWDISLGIIKNKALWKIALDFGQDFYNFLKSFKSMKNGYSSGALRYQIIIADK